MSASAAGTALVTGASSGIGAALATELARRGHDLWLVGRDTGRLDEVASALRSNHGVQVTDVDVDLTGDGVEHVVERLGDVSPPLSVLVNNAGFAVHGSFAETPLEEELALVELQVPVTLRLTKAVLPGMLSRGTGHILNVGSVYSCFPVAWQAVYGAGKAFLGSFSAALARELEGTGVSVTLLCPGTTKTRFRERAGLPESEARGMEADQVAAAACRALFKGRPRVVTGARNRLYVAGSRLLPRRVFAAMLERHNARRGLGGGTR